jgi:hypothetical protein
MKRRERVVETGSMQERCSSRAPGLMERKKKKSYSELALSWKKKNKVLSKIPITFTTTTRRAFSSTLTIWLND